MDVAVKFIFGKRGSHGRIPSDLCGEGSRVSCKGDWILEDRAQDRWLGYLSSYRQAELVGAMRPQSNNHAEQIAPGFTE